MSPWAIPAYTFHKMCEVVMPSEVLQNLKYQKKVFGIDVGKDSMRRQGSNVLCGTSNH